MNAVNPTERVANHLHHEMQEWTGAYLVIGETVDGEPLARFWAPTKEHAERINKIVFAIAAAGGVKFEEQYETTIAQK